MFVLRNSIPLHKIHSKKFIFIRWNNNRWKTTHTTYENSKIHLRIHIEEVLWCDPKRIEIK